MNAIIIDDQKEVVLGMLTGVRWKALGISETFCAYSAGEARRIIAAHPMDLMLCDIEMPAENGLQLYAWVKENYPKVKCIFLTSHMEFDYALTALKLESFDYILQPAKYSVVEEAIKKALGCIREESRREMLTDYGAHWKNSEKEILDLLLRDMVLRPEHSLDSCKFLRLMHNLGYAVDAETRFIPMFIHAFSWSVRLVDWDQELIKDTIENVISELCERAGINNLMVMVSRDEIIFLLYKEDHMPVQWSQVHEICCEFETFVNTYMRAQQGIYLGEECALSQIPNAIRKLYDADRDNISKRAGIFRQRPDSGDRGVQHCSEIHRWKELLCSGFGKIFLKEVREYLGDADKHGLNDSRGLSFFHQEFLQVIFGAAQDMKIDITSLVETYPLLGAYIRECRNLDEMRDFAALAVESFGRLENCASEDSSLIDRAKLYIQKNVESDLSRNDIAGHLYLNPDYLSRMFRKKTGQSLKDYIVEMKIERAKYLMEHTPLSIGAVASKVGFANFSYFSQVFKKITGETPMEYRRHFGEGSSGG